MNLFIYLFIENILYFLIKTNMCVEFELYFFCRFYSSFTLKIRKDSDFKRRRFIDIKMVVLVIVLEFITDLLSKYKQ